MSARLRAMAIGALMACAEARTAAPTREPLSDFNNQPHSHEVLRGIRKLVDSHPGDRVLVGEVNIRSTARVAEYYGAGDELHMSFNFPPLDAPWDPTVFRMCVREVERELGGVADVGAVQSRQ